MSIWKKPIAGMLSLSMLLAAYGPTTQVAGAVGEKDYQGALKNVVSASKGDARNVVNITYNDGVKGKVTFLENGIFRFNVDPTGKFSEYAEPIDQEHVARIQQYPDSSPKYARPEAKVNDSGSTVKITCGKTTIELDKATAKMTVKRGNEVVLSEKQPLSLGDTTVQTLDTDEKEYFYGGGTQNGRFSHKGESIQIANTNNWVDGGVASPNPFYWSTDGYGVLRNTFAQGSYDFGEANGNSVVTSHNEKEFDAYYFVSQTDDKAQFANELLGDYYKVTGNPVLLPEYGFYLGHLNCYNRDGWTDNQQEGGGAWEIKGDKPADQDGEIRYEYGKADGYLLPNNVSAETLNGTAPTVHKDKFKPKDTDHKYSAQAVIDRYKEHDVPFAWFLPNDGYGCGYGQNGYKMTGGVDANGKSSAERIQAVDANVENLKVFTEYANERGIDTGLWTQSNLTPVPDESMEWHKLRDFRKEVEIGGVSTLKTDVAWVGDGYSFGLNGTKTAYDIATDESDGKKEKTRPNIITLDGWAGTQRFGSIWTGDQTGGNWEYIRFHIPTYIGQGLSGNPNIGSDMDGIFGGSPVISTRDYQWKTFTPQMLDMDGWGKYAKSPFTHGDPYTDISRMYLKLKAQLMPYIYTTAAAASDVHSDNNDAKLPMIRAMFLEAPNDDYAYGKETQYQYMFGNNFLVAPVYQNTAAQENGDDIRNNIYLPNEKQVWIDYFTGKQYQGGQIVNNFDAPLWKLPLFVKNGAIIPMYEEHNNPNPVTATNKDGLDKTKRIFEFYPDGNTSYTLYEDDGRSIDNKMDKTDKAYGTQDNISYGDKVTTTITSKVEGDDAVLEVQASKGTYKNYKSDRSTKFVVNVSEKPQSITASHIGADTKDLAVEEAKDLKSFEEAVATDKAIWFYDANPAVSKHAPAGIKNTRTPKVYVKLPQVDVSNTSQKVVVHGFKNVDPELGKNVQNAALKAPSKVTTGEVTPREITLKWNAVDKAKTYEVEFGGKSYNVGSATEFTFTNLSYDTSYDFKVRSRNTDGFSKWSNAISVKTLLDPYRNVPDAKKAVWTGESWGNHTADLAFDKVFQEGDGGFHSNKSSTTQDHRLIVDYGSAYQLEKIEYYPRTDVGNGTVTKMRIETSLDGNHWQEVGVFDWPKDASTKTVDLTGKNILAEHVKFTALESVGNFFAASEIMSYKKEGTKGLAIGSNLGNETVAEADYSNLLNYKGVSTVFKPEVFESQIRKYHADLNENGVYDAYDYAYTMHKLDGGPGGDWPVKGAVHLKSDARDVKAGEEFTITLQANLEKDAFAATFGALYPYDTSVMEFVDGSITLANDEQVKKLTDLSINQTAGNKGMVNLAFSLRGAPSGIGGEFDVATFKMRAKKDISGAVVTKEQYDNAVAVGAGFAYIGDLKAETTLPGTGAPEPGTNPEKPESDEIPQDQFTATAGSEEAGAEPLSNALDNNPGTNWSTKWNEDIAPEDTWVEFALKAPTTVGAIRYLPRADGSKYGIIKKAEVKIPSATNENEWVSVATAEWTEDAGWKTVSFDPVTVSKIRLYSVESVKTKEDKNTVSAAELRLIKGKEKSPEGGGSGGETKPDKPEKPSKIETIPTVPGKPESVQGYTDVQNHWAQDAIAWAVTNNLFEGISDTQFVPNNAMTRGMLVTVLHRLAGKPSTGQNTFSDVPANAYFADAVAWADEVGVVTGIGENRFAPNANITREQLAVILYRFAGAPEVKDASIKFADAANVSAWAKDAVAWAVDEGILSGMEDGTLAPKGQATRAQVATILMRYEQSNHKSE